MTRLRRLRRLGVALALASLVLLLPAVASGALPTATPSPSVLGTGDPRSDGEGPGLVGSPIVVALGVVGLGVVVAGGTLLVMRLTRPD